MNRLIFAITLAVGLLTGGMNASADVIYNVDRAWSNATLVGTVDVELGNYSIQNQGAHPFNAVNLVLTVGGTSFNVNNVLTDVTFGTGVFNIQATSTQLIFNAAGDGSNPADLIFSSGGTGNDRYAIGSDSTPAFEIAFTSAGNPSDILSGFPVVWGTTAAVPVPSSLIALATLCVAGMFAARRSRGQTA